jgi:hypothetical protein
MLFLRYANYGTRDPLSSVSGYGASFSARSGFIAILPKVVGVCMNHHSPSHNRIGARKTNQIVRIRELDIALGISLDVVAEVSDVALLSIQFGASVELSSVRVEVVTR